MIVFCEELMPRVLKVSCTSDWDKDNNQHIDDSVNRLKNIMEQTEFQFVFLWILNKNIPFSIILKIASKLVLLHNELKTSIDFNILYCNNDDSLKLIQKVLSIYQPEGTIKIAKTKEEVLELINSSTSL
jgi:hypothetical protein